MILYNFYVCNDEGLYSMSAKQYECRGNISFVPEIDNIWMVISGFNTNFWDFCSCLCMHSWQLKETSRLVNDKAHALHEIIKLHSVEIHRQINKCSTVCSWFCTKYKPMTHPAMQSRDLMQKQFWRFCARVPLSVADNLIWLKFPISISLKHIRVNLQSAYVHGK